MPCPYSGEMKDVTSKSIDGITDLVVWAPIKDGFIDAFANVTYETRLKVVAEALHNMRKAAREYETLSAFPDTAERILSLLDYRIGIADEGLYRFEDDKGNPVPMVGSEKNVTLKPKRYMYLVATFDGPWEPYMRLIWKPLGPFLDLLLCNCEGYVTAGDNGFGAYAEWVRNNQLDSGIFYSTSGFTVKDKKYLEKMERLHTELSPNNAAEAIAKMTSDDPEALAREVRSRPENRREINRMALEALNVLYKLTDYYPADQIFNGKNKDGSYKFGEGAYLLRVVKEILADWTPEVLPEPIKLAYKDPINWFLQHKKGLYPRPLPPKSAVQESDYRFPTELKKDDHKNIQKGLLTPYDPPHNKEAALTDGALYMLRVDNVNDAKTFLKNLEVSYEEQAKTENMTLQGPNGILTVNVAFTHNGLKKLCVDPDITEHMPKEFRDGMEMRAPTIGDKFGNHPRRWTLPERFVPPLCSPEDGVCINPTLDEEPKKLPPVEMHEIDVVIQLRTNLVKRPGSTVGKTDFIDFSSPKAFEGIIPRQLPEDLIALAASDTASYGSQSNILSAAGLILDDYKARLENNIAALRTGFSDVQNQSGDTENQSQSAYQAATKQVRNPIGMTLLSIQSLYRHRTENEDSQQMASEKNWNSVADHFGFQDGISQPVIASPPKQQFEVPPGEILCGYQTARDSYVNNKDPRSVGKTKADEFMKNGSFLAIRKIRQNVLEFEDFLDRKHGEVGCSRDDLAALIVGRKRDGRPLIASVDNNFNYDSDKEGQICPFTSHIRRANPRGEFHGRKDPMILRRGMSYGKRFDPNKPDNERGVVFMAYCANLAEQYETIQSWINGSNSTGKSSVQTDPLVGLFPRDRKNIFQFFKNGKHHKIEIDRPFTKLEWGMYLFTPSRQAFEKIIEETHSPKNNLAEQGAAVVAALDRMAPEQSRQEWKRILEDYLTKDPSERNITQKVNAAITAMGGARVIERGIAFDNSHKKQTRKGKNDERIKLAEQRCIYVTDEKLIMNVFNKSDKDQFSSSRQGKRMDRPDGFGMIYVARDPSDPEYSTEAYPTNDFLMQYCKDDDARAFMDGYLAGTAALLPIIAIAEKAAASPEKAETKIEIGRQYISEALGWLCHTWFGVPDAPAKFPDTEDKGIIAKGPWTWTPQGKKRSQAVCPGDFMSPSRWGFYPRPTETIEKYGLADGKRLRKAVERLIKNKKDEGINGTIGRQMWDALKGEPDKLERNLIGIMIGALPPMDANLRFMFQEWLKEDTLWDHQAKYVLAMRKAGQSAPNYKIAKAALEYPIKRAMSLRPAPDLIYRTAGKIMTEKESGLPVDVQKDDLIVLSLVGATQSRIRRGETPDVNVVFGGDRYKEGHPPHACPAQKMAMDAMTGIVAAFFDAGRIQALPAPMIVRLSECVSSKRLFTLPAIIKIADQVLALINSEEYPEGYTLPATSELAGRLGVNDELMGLALTILAERKHVEIKPGMGVVVRKP